MKKRTFAIKQERSNLFLIYEVDQMGNKTLVNETCEYIYEVDKFIEMNNGIVIEKDMISEVKNGSDKRGLLFD